MAKMYYQADCDLNLLSEKTVAVLGYGSQGHAHAQNLRDSGVKTVVGLRADSARWEVAKKDGLSVYEVPEAVKMADIVMLLLPDEVQATVYEESIRPNLKSGGRADVRARV